MSRRLLVACGAALATALASCSSPEPPPPPTGVLASLTTPPRVTTGPTPGTGEPGTTGATYLALGDSLAAGFQPGLGDQPTRGYAGPVLEHVRRSRPATELVNLGCSGETTTSMTGGGPCRYDQGSQLAAAVAFLRANADRTLLVTLDIGANDVLRCASGAIDTACATSRTATVARNLGAILGALRAAAPTVTIVVLTYYDPLLGAWRNGPDGRRLATQSVTVLQSLDQIVTKAAGAVGAKVADVAAAFSTTDLSTPRDSTEPVNVTTVCTLTWMCSRNDIHANDAGYAAMAAAVIAATR